MPTSYSIAPISPETLDRAFPLLRAIAPALTQEEWRRHCRKLTTPLADNDPATSREETVVAVNSQGYVKGLCLYSIRDHWIYGRLLDVPIFDVASAADAEGVGKALLQFLQRKCDRSVCSGVRFWTMGALAWDRRLNEEDIRRTDHGIFTPAIVSFAEIENVLSASMLADHAVIDRLSR
jgi:hypothetical protein